jgi:RNA polymerase sigma-70 factor, ECF subfamily
MQAFSNSTLDDIYRRDARKVFATLVRLLGNFDLAEEALHDAFIAAAERWPQEGVPGNPSAWLVSTGRFKAIDAKENGAMDRGGRARRECRRRGD